MTAELRSLLVAWEEQDAAQAAVDRARQVLAAALVHEETARAKVSVALADLRGAVRADARSVMPTRPEVS